MKDKMSPSQQKKTFCKQNIDFRQIFDAVHCNVLIVIEIKSPPARISSRTFARPLVE